MSTPVQSGLFPETPAERAQRIDAEILDLLLGKPGGRFKETLQDAERAVLQAIRYRRGSANAITIREIQAATQLGDRTVKQAVRTLRVNFRVPVGSSRDAQRGGYFLCITREDLDVWMGEAHAQFRGDIDVLRACASEADILELLTALRAEVT